MPPALSWAQEKPSSPENGAASLKLPAAKKEAPAKASSVAEEVDSNRTQGGIADKDDSEAIRKRDEWFYKQRASVNGHIPAGARLKAFEHMQRMMGAEGKLIRRADGSYAEIANPQSSTSFPAWTSIGPTPTTGGTFSPVTGRITTIAVDSSDTTGNTVLIGGAQGGIWRSTDAGVTWTAVGDQNASLAMGSIAFAPSQAGTVYAGTGEQASIGFDIYYGAGVLKSTDHGQTWTQTCTVAGSTCPFLGPYTDSLHPGFGFFNFGGARISYIAVNPTNPNLILVGAQFIVEGPQEGVYCSSDGGASWTNILPDEMSTFVGFASSSVAFVALGNPYGSSPGASHGNGIYKSTNASSCGATFTPMAGGLPVQTEMGRIELGISPNFATDSTVYASIANGTNASGTNLGVWVTTNGGTSWTQTAAPDVCQNQCWYDDVLKVDPNNKNIAFLGGGAVSDASGNPNWVVRTTTGGTSWSTVIPNQLGAGLPHVDTHALAFFKLPGGKVRLYLGNDGGIWRTDDAEAATVIWTNLNGSLLTLTQFYPSIAISTSSPSIAFGGTQDNGSQNYQGGVAWVDNSLCGDGASTAVDPLVPSTIYIGCATGYPVNVSYQNGTAGTFSPAVSGINPADSWNFIPPLASDPSTPNAVYFGTTKVYQSLDAGNSWNPISSDLVYGSNGDSLTALAVAPGNPNVMYAGGNNGAVFVATNVSAGSASFNAVQNSLPTRNVTAIAGDPNDPTGLTAYVAYSGFAYLGTNPIGQSISDTQGHIFKTTNGVSFTDVSCSVVNCDSPAATDLPNLPVNDVVVDPDVPGTIYAATDLGVYVGNCAVTPCTWSTLGTGLPRVAVLSLRLHEASRTLRAATHGRGVWDIALNNFAFTGPRIFSLTPTSANAGAAQLTLTVTGTGLTGGTIQFGGTALTTTPVQPDTQLTATIPTTLLIAGSQKVTVIVGTPTSNALQFEILSATPALTGCTSSIPAPTTAACGTPVQSNSGSGVQLTLTGSNFAQGAKVLFNGSAAGITTKFNSSTSLTATLPVSLLCCVGSTNDLTVLNVPPGGGKSQSQSFQVVAPPPPNDNFSNAINVTALSFVDAQDTSSATTESTDPVPPCAQQYTSAQGNTGGHANGAYKTIWYKFTPIFSANLEVDTTSSNYDTVLSVWTGSPGSFTLVACNDDINPGVITQSLLPSVALSAGTTYYFMVSSFGPPDPNPVALGGRSYFNFSYNNGDTPAPTLSSITPSSTNSGGPDVALTVTGSGFLSGATVFFLNPLLYGATSLSTTFVSGSEVTAILPAGSIRLPGAYSIYVQNQQPTVGSSNSMNFTVNVGTYPVPTLTTIYPTTVVAGSLGPIPFSALGANFAQTATLNFNGVPQPTVVGGPNNLQASVASSAVANPGTFQVTISNPSPGGGPSNSLSVLVVAPNPLPAITSVTPSTGASGTTPTVTINGSGFLQGAHVSMGNISTSFVNFSSSTQISVILPLGAVPAGTYQLYVVDPAPGGTSAPVNFTVTGPPDFSFTVAAGQGSQTVTAGQTATFSNAIAVTALNGFTGQVVATCSSPAQATTCSVNPGTINAGQSASVMVTTTARGMAPPPGWNRHIISWPRVVPLLVMLLLFFLLTRQVRTRRQRVIVGVPLAGVILFLVLQAVGCGGGSSQPPPPPPPTGTLAGNYTITVTGSSTNPNATHTATLQLTVN